jgi:hypothetical protein
LALGPNGNTILDLKEEKMLDHSNLHSSISTFTIISTIITLTFISICTGWTERNAEISNMNYLFTALVYQ